MANGLHGFPHVAMAGKMKNLVKGALNLLICKALVITLAYCSD